MPAPAALTVPLEYRPGSDLALTSVAILATDCPSVGIARLQPPRCLSLSLVLSLRDLQWESLKPGAGSRVGVGESAPQRVPDGKPVEAHGEKAPGSAPHSSSCHPLTRGSVKIPSHQESRSVLGRAWSGGCGRPQRRLTRSPAPAPCSPPHTLQVH